AALAAARLVTARGPDLRVIASSFSLASIDAVKAAAPSMATGWLTIAAVDQRWAMELAVERGHDALHVQYQAVDAALVDRAHAMGLAVLAWTVDDPDEMRRLTEAGVDSIVTNDVALAVAVRASGQRGD